MPPPPAPPNASALAPCACAANVLCRRLRRGTWQNLPTAVESSRTTPYHYRQIGLRVKANILFSVDNREEFGGKSWLKVAELRKLIAGFGCRLTQNHRGHCEENAHLERSHRTDDDEFYIPRAMTITSDATLLDEAMRYIYYYNNVRDHSARGNQTPFAFLKQQAPDIDEAIRCIQPILLDTASVSLEPWSGYNVLTHNHAGNCSGLGSIISTPQLVSSFDKSQDGRVALRFSHHV